MANEEDNRSAVSKADKSPSRAVVAGDALPSEQGNARTTATIPPANITDWLQIELDKKLATMPDDGERYYFLSRQYNVWNQRRNRFFATDGESESQAPHPQFGFLTATDFLLILGMIDRAKDKLVRAKESA